jgi:hypothetical protein
VPDGWTPAERLNLSMRHGNSLTRGITKANDFRQYNEVMPRRSEETAEPLLIDRAAAAELHRREHTRMGALLVTDLLIGMGRTGRIIELKIGVPVRGHRGPLTELGKPRDGMPMTPWRFETSGVKLFCRLAARLLRLGRKHNA